MKTIKLSLIFLLILAIGVSALEVSETECKKDGSLKLVLKADSTVKTYTEDIGVKVVKTPIFGTWNIIYVTKSESASREYATFQSDENILTAKRSYPINIDYKETKEEGTKLPKTLSFEVECPGLLFSCKNLNISIESCENQKTGLFRAVLNVKGLEQSDLAKMDIMNVVDFLIEAENKYKDSTGKETSRGTLPLKSQVTRLEKDKYVIRYEFSSKNNNTVKSLWLGYNNNLIQPCKQDQYPEVEFYDKIECSKEETLQQEQKEEVVAPSEIKEDQKSETPTQNKKTADQILQQQPKNYKPLAIVSIILIVVLSIGGIILSYLYKKGYL